MPRLCVSSLSSYSRFDCLVRTMTPVYASTGVLRMLNHAQAHGKSHMHARLCPSWPISELKSKPINGICAHHFGYISVSKWLQRGLSAGLYGIVRIFVSHLLVNCKPFQAHASPNYFC